jgi:hypothetical protein
MDTTQTRDKITFLVTRNSVIFNNLIRTNISLEKKGNVKIHLRKKGEKVNNS